MAVIKLTAIIILLITFFVISFHGPQIGHVERPHYSIRAVLNQFQDHRDVATLLKLVI